MTRFGVLRHLGVLEQPGLVTTRKERREKRHLTAPGARAQPPLVDFFGYIAWGLPFFFLALLTRRRWALLAPATAWIAADIVFRMATSAAGDQANGDISSLEGLIMVGVAEAAIGLLASSLLDIRLTEGRRA